IAAGCSKKVAVKPAPPPAVQQAKASAPEKPVISLFAAAPGTIDKGGDTTLRWAVEHANNVQIALALGQVDESGSQRVFPNADTVYTLTATDRAGPRPPRPVSAFSCTPHPECRIRRPRTGDRSCSTAFRTPTSITTSTIFA